MVDNCERKKRRASIALSLAGDGEVISLTGTTVRPVFNLLQTVEPRVGYRFRYPWLTSAGSTATVYERLVARGSVHFDRHEVRRIGEQVNHLLIDGELQIPMLGNRVEKGYLLTSDGPIQVRRKSQSLIWNGACFEVRQVSVKELLTTDRYDVFLEEEGIYHFSRYLGPVVKAGEGIGVKIASRYDLARCAIWSQDRLRLSRVYRVVRAMALPGFHIARIVPFV
jgi:hypothetical protein